MELEANAEDLLTELASVQKNEASALLQLNNTKKYTETAAVVHYIINIRSLQELANSNVFEFEGLKQDTERHKYENRELSRQIEHLERELESKSTMLYSNSYSHSNKGGKQEAVQRKRGEAARTWR